MWEVIITIHQCECRANKKKNAKHRFEKTNFKLINNSIYGKIMRNVKKRTDMKLVAIKNRIIWCYNQAIIQQNAFQKIC